MFIYDKEVCIRLKNLHCAFFSLLFDAGQLYVRVFIHCAKIFRIRNCPGDQLKYYDSSLFCAWTNGSDTCNILTSGG